MTVLRFLGFRSVLLILAGMLLAALAIRVDTVTAHRDAAVASLATATDQLATVKADVARIARDRTTAIVVMAQERDRAVKAEQEASDLRTKIAKDAGTARDGEVAPVLRDALEALQRTASRQDSLYLGRRPDVWLLLVMIDGRIERRDYAKDEKTCRDVAMASALELAARPELVSDAARVRISCTPSRPGGSA